MDMMMLTMERQKTHTMSMDMIMESPVMLMNMGMTMENHVMKSMTIILMR